MTIPVLLAFLLSPALARAQAIDVAPYVLAIDPAHRGAEVAEIHPAFDLDVDAKDFGGKSIPAVWRSNGLVTGLMGIRRFGPAVPAFLCWERGGRKACPPLAPLAGAARMTRMQSDAVAVEYVPFDGTTVTQTYLAQNAHLFRSRARAEHAGAALSVSLLGGVVEESETGRLKDDALAALAARGAREADRDGVHYSWRLWTSRPSKDALEAEFALAFDTDAARARAAAEGARSVPFDAALALRSERSESAYRSGPGVDFHDPALNLFERIQWERLRGLAENAAGNIPFPFFMGTSAPWGIDGLWLWDAAFVSQTLQYSDPVWAEQAIEAVLAQQSDDGLVPHWSTPHSRTRISQPPVLSWAARRLYTFHGDRAFLERVYPRLARLHRWFQKERTRADGQPFWKQPDESGMDNSPAFDEGTDAHVDLAAELAADAGELALIARELGKEADASDWEERRAAWRVRVERLWGDGPEGPFYFPMKGRRRVPVYSVQGFFPLLDESLPPERRAALLARLQDPAQFWTPFPIPSVSLRSPQFMQPKWFANTYGSPETGRRVQEKLEDYSSVYWRGPVWVFSDALVYEGLRRGGDYAAANELARRMTAMMREAAKVGGMLWENFDPRDGKPSRLLPKGQADEMAASIYFLKTLYDSTLGVEPALAPTDKLLRLAYTAVPSADAARLRFGPWTLSQSASAEGVRLRVVRRPAPDAVLEVENRAGAALAVAFDDEPSAAVRPGEMLKSP